MESVEGTFYKTLTNYVDTMMTDEHVPTKALTTMLLSLISRSKNLISLEKSLSLQVLVVDFLLTSHDWKSSLCNLPSSKVEVEF